MLAFIDSVSTQEKISNKKKTVKQLLQNNPIVYISVWKKTKWQFYSWLALHSNQIHDGKMQFILDGRLSLLRMECN